MDVNYNHVAIEERIKRIRKKGVRRLTKYSLGRSAVQEVEKSEFEVVDKSEFEVVDRDVVPGPEGESQGVGVIEKEIELEDEVFVIEDCDRFNNNNRYSENKKLNDDIMKMNNQTATISSTILSEQEEEDEEKNEKNGGTLEERLERGSGEVDEGEALNDFQGIVKKLRATQSQPRDIRCVLYFSVCLIV